MTVLLSFYGSRGDVQPGVCLALELRRRGREVAMAVPPNYVPFAQSLGLTAHPIGVDSESYWESERSQQILATRNPVTKTRLAAAQVREGFAQFDADLSAFVEELREQTSLEGFVSGPLGQERVLAWSEKLSVPMATMRFCAMSRNGVINAVPTAATLPPPVNRASWDLADRLTWTFTRGAENRFRATLGLPAARAPLARRLQERDVTEIQAYDPALFPGLEREWGARRPLVGFLDLPAEARDPLGEAASRDRDLMRWVEEDAPPVFVSFGSAPVARPDALREVVVTVAAELGIRVILGLPPESGSRQPHRHVFFARRFDHAAVLPRCRAAIHHGGAGTVAATLRAGLPTMVCPAGADQLHWAAQIRRLGVGASARLSRLDGDHLRNGLRTLLLPRTAQSAHALSDRMIPPKDASAAAADATDAALSPSRR